MIKKRVYKNVKNIQKNTKKDNKNKRTQYLNNAIMLYHLSIEYVILSFIILYTRHSQVC